MVPMIFSLIFFHYSITTMAYGGDALYADLVRQSLIGATTCLQPPLDINFT